MNYINEKTYNWAGLEESVRVRVLLRDILPDGG